MRKYSAAILLLALLSSTCYNLAVFSYWLANRSYIATELCINKAKPELKCNGKCYLKKNLKQELPSQEQEENLPQAKPSTEVFTFHPHNLWVCSEVVSWVLSQSSLPSSQQSMHSTEVVWSLLKPPMA